MGYYSTISGEITINPPLTWDEIKDTKFMPESGDDRLLRIARLGAVIEDNIGDQAKYYDLDIELVEIAAAYPDRTFDGYIVRVGEEAGDVERYWIVDGRVRTETASLVWPDGSVVQC